MKRVIWEDPVTGALCQTVPSPAWLAANQGVDMLTLPGVPAGVQAKVILDTEAKSDRTFRNAWKFDTSLVHGCGIDMSKAADIARERVRLVRDPKLATLDAAYIRADEQNKTADKLAIAARKQTLRDAPADSRITNAVTEADLKAAMLTVITEVEAV